MMMDLRKEYNVLWIAFFLNTIGGIGSADMQYNTPIDDQNSAFPKLTIPQGTLQGITLLSRHNRSFSAFLGIPYAQPPTGKLRFSNPVAANAWKGTLNASLEGSACPQVEDVGEEDCLYLNVYTPQLPRRDDASLLPVMVFVPGGGFESGGSRSSSYGPSYLLDADLILVTINYRLGPLGFLSTGDEVAPGNWGLKDQVLSLQWVQKSIAYFGGDPNQVTIFGQSAGGASVQLLALSDSTIGLFHKYISQSGAAFGPWVHQPRSSAAKLARQLGEFLGCPINSSSLLVDCLRHLEVSEIINTRSRFFAWNRYPLVKWAPTDEPNIEGALLIDTPANLIAAGKNRDLPSITGVVRDESIIFMPGIVPESDTFAEFLDNFDDLLPIVLQYSDKVENVSSFTAALKDFYFNNDLTTNRIQVWSNCVKLISDIWFMYPVYDAIKKQLVSTKNSPFFYSFEYRGLYGYANQVVSDAVVNTTAIHGDELFYLFNPRKPFGGTLSNEVTEIENKMIDTMIQLWTTFAIKGIPTTTSTISNTTWMPFSSDNEYLRIGSHSEATLNLRYNFLQERMRFWDELTARGSGNTAAASPVLIFIFLFLTAYPKILSLTTRAIIDY